MSITLTPALSLKGEGVGCLVDEPVSQIIERPWPPPGQALTPVSGHGAGFYGMRWVELFCVKLGESVAFVGGKVFEKPALAALTCPVHS